MQPRRCNEDDWDGRRTVVVRSAAIRERVLAVRERQTTRFAESQLLTNVDMGPRQLGTFVPLDATCESILARAVRQLQ